MTNEKKARREQLIKAYTASTERANMTKAEIEKEVDEYMAKETQEYTDMVLTTYDDGVEEEITIDGKNIKGMLYGNDECFDDDDFFQYFIADDKSLYKCYYTAPEGDFDALSDLDYSNPNCIEEI